MDATPIRAGTADAVRGQRLTLDLGYAAGELRATLRASDRARAPIQTRASRPFVARRVRGLHEQIISVLNRANRWGDMDQGSWDLLRQRGQLLFDEVLPAEIKDALRDIEGAELTLVLDEELVFIPWELMHTGAGFLGLAHAVGRIVRTPRRARGAARGLPQGPWRMLILCDPRGDLMASYYEGVTLRDELDVARRRLAIDLRASEVGVADVKELVREYDVIHYAGHAELHRDRPDDSGWLLSDGVLAADALLDLAGGRPFPRLVFSNACRSGAVAEPLVATDREEMIFGLANAFLLSGVQHYVGTLWDVPDEPACHFSLAFYESLLTGQSLGQAMRCARGALRDRYGDDTVLWASYVLYGDPCATCFADAEPAAQKARTPAEPPRQRPDPSLPEADTGPRMPRPAVTRVRGGRPDSWAGADSERPRHQWSTWFWWGVFLAVLAGGVVGILALSGGSEPERPRWVGPEIEISVEPEAIPVNMLVPVGGAKTDPDATAGALGGGEEESPAPAPQPDFVAVVQVPRGLAGETKELAAGEVATLKTADNFRLRYRLSEPGFAAIWHIASQGDVRRIHPADETVERVDSARAWRDVPSSDKWFFLDDRRGREIFVLGANPALPFDETNLTDELEQLSKKLVRTRAARAARPKGKPQLVMRGIGGERPAVSLPPTDDDEILEALRTVFERHYKSVRLLELRHQ